MSLDNQLVQYFDEWEQSLPPDARAALRPLFDQARASASQESVTVTEKGPWHVSDWGEGRLAIQSGDFTHDGALEFSGDFATPADKRAHAEEIARRLNAYPALAKLAREPATQPVAAINSNGRAVLWDPNYAYEPWISKGYVPLYLDHAADLYTCIGKDGAYALIGEARGAGDSRGKPDVLVYRSIETGRLFYRNRPDFGKRMRLVGDISFDGKIGTANGGKDES